MLKIMGADAADLQIPQRICMRQRPRRFQIRKAVTATTGIAGFVLAMAVERSLWFALPALGLMAATLVLQAKE